MVIFLCFEVWLSTPTLKETLNKLKSSNKMIAGGPDLQLWTI